MVSQDRRKFSSYWKDTRSIMPHSLNEAPMSPKNVRQRRGPVSYDGRPLSLVLRLKLIDNWDWIIEVVYLEVSGP